jgi:site-specific DNA-methyltransferase (adenine-specific)
VGFDYMGAIIWQKVTTTNTTGGGTVMGSYPYPRNGVVRLDYEFILLFRKLGTPPRPSRERKEASRLTAEEWQTCFSGHWNFPGERQHGHLAMFPQELPRRLTRMFTMVGDVVLDPFLGSGTTCLAARELGRASIGYEINPDFVPVIEGKLKGGDVELERLPLRSRSELEAATASLPYRFRDPVQVTRKLDPRQATYGSRIDGREAARRDLRAVAEVPGPDSVVLDDGVRVRLLGVAPLKGRERRAVERLWELVRGKKVYWREDPACPAENGPPLVYLYLRNRTPVNRHLIRTGLVSVDTRRDYRFRKAFQEERRRARRRG